MPDLLAIVEAEALYTAEIATKRDIEKVEGQLRDMKAEINGKLTLVQWMLALLVAVELLPIFDKIFIAG